MSRITFATVAGLALVASATSAQAITYFDGIFNNPDWTLTVINNAAGAGSSSVGFQVPAGGNPAEYRRIRNSVVVASGLPNGAVIGFHMNNTAFYNPGTSGAISNIAYSEDSINFVSNTVVPGNGQGTGLAILQGGRYYRLQNPALVMPFTSFSNWGPNAAPTITAADMAEVDLAGNVNVFSNPDFSAAGGIMQLGFWRGNSGNSSYNTDCGIDNWNVNITSVPAPAAAALLGMGGLLAGRRRR